MEPEQASAARAPCGERSRQGRRTRYGSSVIGLALLVEVTVPVTTSIAAKAWCSVAPGRSWSGSRQFEEAQAHGIGG